MTGERDGSVCFLDGVSAVIWAVLMAFHAPASVIGAAEIAAGLGFLALSGLLLRHALKLARTGWA